MRIGELRRRTGATLRALRYYEEQGLVVPSRHPNGYRDYAEVSVSQVQQIRQLTRLGLTVEQTRPFVECLAGGHADADDCVSSLAVYGRAIDDLSQRIETLSAWRERLQHLLDEAANRAIPTRVAPVAARPPAVTGVVDTGKVDPARVVGRRVPDLALPSTDGRVVRLQELPGVSIVYVYPLSGRPGVDLPQGWDTIPGARGCTAEACGFRDHHDELCAAGAGAVFGLSSQPTAYQRELALRLRLPYPLLSDARLHLAEALNLPTFEAGPHLLFTRLTMAVGDGMVRKVWHPIDAPAEHADEVLSWLRSGAGYAS